MSLEKISLSNSLALLSPRRKSLESGKFPSVDSFIDADQIEEEGETPVSPRSHALWKTKRANGSTKKLTQSSKGAVINVRRTNSMINSPFSRTSSAQRVPEVTKKSASQWRSDLSRDEFLVLRMNDMETPFSGRYLRIPAADGVYLCRGCKNPVLSTKSQVEKKGSKYAIFKDSIPAGCSVEVGKQHEQLLCRGCQSFLGIVIGPEEMHVNSLAVKFHRVTSEQHKLLLRGKDPGPI
mmetsp:Transcript_13492/g.24196  ORF Transcript_13492/g.24196 Transcript_13492/m.24196 type:complete len:237 (-) Transcript_13492:193-903(-)|eukprot:CAMPEP_0182447322 /NCGR_PEP_ID=MMETSP1172-20130603/14542_1 /TAXON_ID=708627 /ORGANISM="Timspurckia oligopyrenoides, Strain CCMP3278" /LENGTH=236 /DNA_ID=CAMNT_0024643715 /DNA_START=168 /DNA_END=878 /DNA_ORIENTATION=-